MPRSARPIDPAYCAVFVPFEDIFPRETWKVAPCEQCGKPGTIKPDHPAWTCALCEDCIAALIGERD